MIKCPTKNLEFWISAAALNLIYGIEMGQVILIDNELRELLDTLGK